MKVKELPSCKLWVVLPALLFAWVLSPSALGSLTKDDPPVHPDPPKHPIFPSAPSPIQSFGFDNLISGQCQSRRRISLEPFVMKMNLCRKNVSLSCEIGGNNECKKDESFKATAIVAKHTTQCLIEGNTTSLKYIQFVVRAKYLKNLNELGSRSLTEDEPEPEIQRGKCTLGYTCIDGKYLKDMRVNCFSFHYNKREEPFNGTRRKFEWTAPKDYTGPVVFNSMAHISYSSFYIDVETAEIIIPGEKKAYKV